MTDERTWEHIRSQRLALADLLDGLDAAQWETRSLCSAWRVQDVVAHLVVTPACQPTVPGLAAALVRARGRLWDAGRDVAVAYAQRGPRSLRTQLRDLAASRSKPVFVHSGNILLDVLVHAQDVAVPLGVEHPVPVELAGPALDQVWAMGWPFHARRRLAGVTLVDTGSGWRAGEGPEARADSATLLLLTTGRSSAASRLEGPGAALVGGA